MEKESHLFVSVCFLTKITLNVYTECQLLHVTCEACCLNKESTAGEGNLSKRQLTIDLIPQPYLA